MSSTAAGTELSSTNCRTATDGALLLVSGKGKQLRSQSQDPLAQRQVLQVVGGSSTTAPTVDCSPVVDRSPAAPRRNTSKRRSFIGRLTNRIRRAASPNAPPEADAMGCTQAKGSDGGGGAATAAPAAAETPAKTIDPKTPFATYRDFYTVKNFWKAVMRREKEAGKMVLKRFLQSNSSYQALYPKLAKLDLNDDNKCDNSTAFEKMALAYLGVFDDVVNAIEANPSDCTDACERLKEAGQLHKGKIGDFDSGVFQNLEEPFLNMVSIVLEDRYTDKAEGLFRKFFQFCLKYIVEGYNS